MSFSCFDNSNFDYNALVNKPRVNGCTLAGDMSFEDMGLQELINKYTLEYATDCIYPTVDAKLASKQNNLIPGLGINLAEDATISIAADEEITETSSNAVTSSAIASMCNRIYDTICNEVYEAINSKQDALIPGRAISLSNNCISVQIDDVMSNTSTNPVSNCTVNLAIECIMSEGYQAGNGIAMTTDECGCHVVSLADCINVQCDLSVKGSTVLEGSVVVCGDIYQCGTSYCTHAEEIFTNNDYINLRDNAVAGLANDETAGFVVLKYNGTDDAVISVDNTGTWHIGETDGDPNQILATRSDSSLWNDSALAMWDSSNYCFTPTNIYYNNDTNTTIANSCNDKNPYTLKGTIDSANKLEVHNYQSFDALATDISTNETKQFSRYDNVTGYACVFCENNIFAWQQQDCTVDFERLCDGLACNAKTCKYIFIDPVGSEPLIYSSTDDVGTNAYGFTFYDDMLYRGNNECMNCCNFLALCSNCGTLYDEVECYVATQQCTVLLRTDKVYNVTTDGNTTPGCYSSCDKTSLPSYCVICTSNLCYYQDNGTSYCSDCSYYSYDANTLTYQKVALTVDDWQPNYYYLRCESSYNINNCFDVYYTDIGGATEKVDGECFISNTYQPIDNDFRLCRSFITDTMTMTCEETADTMCIVYTCKYPITNVSAKIYEQNYRLTVTASNNGCNYLVHSYGIPGNYIEQDRIKQGISSHRYCCFCLNNGNWSQWENVALANTDVSPCFDTVTGSIGTSVYAARADHTHPSVGVTEDACFIEDWISLNKQGCTFFKNVRINYNAPCYTYCAGTSGQTSIDVSITNSCFGGNNPTICLCLMGRYHPRCACYKYASYILRNNTDAHLVITSTDNTVVHSVSPGNTYSIGSIVNYSAVSYYCMCINQGSPVCGVSYLCCSSIKISRFYCASCPTIGHFVNDASAGQVVSFAL